MSKDKQIEEMAKDIRLNMQILPNPEEHPSHQMARLLVQDGYAKASDVAEEIFAEIESIVDYDTFPIAHRKLARIIAELKKKYIGEDRDKLAEFGKYSPLSWKYTEEGK